MHLVLLVGIVMIENELNLRRRFSMPTFSFAISLTLGFSLGVVFIYQSMTGFQSKANTENAKIHMHRSRFCLWVLAALCLSKLVIDFYALETFANEIKEKAEQISDIANHNGGSGIIPIKIGVVFNNGTALYVPDNSSCIIQPSNGDDRRINPNKYYSNERRLLNEDANSVNSQYYGGFKYCKEDQLLIINVDILKTDIEKRMVVTCGILYAIMVLVFVLGCIGVSHTNKKYFEACVEYEQNKPVDTMSYLDNQIQNSETRIDANLGINHPKLEKDFEQLDSQ